MTKKQKKLLIRIIISGILFITAWMLPLSGPMQLIAFLIPYIVIGWDIVWKALRNILHGQIFDENFLMVIATIGAFVLGIIKTHDYAEAVGVMLFYQVGELFQSYAVSKSRQSIAQLMDIRPDYASIEQDGTLIQVDPSEVHPGDIIIVQPGEKIPLDGIVSDGFSTIDTSALTGESIPRDAQAGNEVISGCVNLTGVLRIKVTKAFGESTVSKILDLVENASSKKAKAEHFITKFARWYTPCVVIAAVLLATLPPLFFEAMWTEWVERALIFLVISCPCALVISIPLSFFGGIGGASRCGILVKGGNYLEALAKTDVVVFDKTGTLTKGTFQVTAIHPEQGITSEQLLETAALAEIYSKHPISLSLQNAAGEKLDANRVKNVQELAGLGLTATIDGHNVAVGNLKLMKQLQIDAALPCHLTGTSVYVAIDQVYTGHIIISDEMKEDASKAIQLLKQAGIRKTVMLTGDSRQVGEAVSQQLGLDEVYTQLLPSGKVEKLEQLLKEQAPNKKLAFVGDGVNDAPVLSRADIGIAMGGLGSDAAIEAADIVLMDDAPSKISTAIRISKKTLRIVQQNIIIALGIKGLFLLLGAFGMANMWEAVFADVGVAVIAILNAARALNVKEFQ
ncbi:heavy metal translocating P-type ATPase [uncultured Ruthenibacterium sp.]|mgnify:CR=1 FL=1|uniref:heavy metal translocating P-type ATPase n=1 Tax=uncultured Ruthenibacterium sp. TaxID=1905347 RepID=UPI00349E68B1